MRGERREERGEVGERRGGEGRGGEGRGGEGWGGMRGGEERGWKGIDLTIDLKSIAKSIHVIDLML